MHSTSTSNATSSSSSSVMSALSALSPVPSLPGLAFACCAACLPLLQSRNTTIGRAVHSLLKIALPFVLEPRLEGSAVGLILQEIEHARLTHLLNRMEQVPYYILGGYLSYIVYACTSFSCWLSCTFLSICPAFCNGLFTLFILTNLP